MNYVLHICKNKECNNGWIDKDLTQVSTIPPKWKYCKECCKKFGIDYNKQTPTSNLTEEQKTKREKRIQNLKDKRNKMLKDC